MGSPCAARRRPPLAPRESVHGCVSRRPQERPGSKGSDPEFDFLRQPRGLPLESPRVRSRVRYPHQGPLAAHPVSFPALRDRLPGSRQRRLRRARHESRAGVQRRRLRVRLRDLLPELHAARGAQQPAAGAVWRAPLDRSHHVHVGAGLDGDGLRHHAALVLCAALHPRCGRSRILSRLDPLPDLLVSRSRARTCNCVVHDGHRHGRRHRRTDLQRDPATAWCRRPTRVAVALHHRRPARRAPRARRPSPAHRATC